MPIYLFECTICGDRFEISKKADDNELPKCPHGHANTQRIYTVPTVTYHGPGFYTTDQRKKEKKKTS